MLYRASNRDAAVEDVLNELVASTPTPEGYGVAARLWTILGDPSRAEALRSDARTRFRGDPSLPPYLAAAGASARLWALGSGLTGPKPRAESRG